MTLRDDIEDDLEDVYYDPDEFGTVAVWTDSSGTDHNLPGQYSAPHEEANIVTGLIETTVPQYKCKYSRVGKNIKPGDKVVVNETTYYFLSQAPDEYSIETTLYLSEDAP